MTKSRHKSYFSILLLSVAVCFLGCNKDNEEPVNRAEKGEVPTAKKLGMRVTAEELADRLGDKNLLILDARSSDDYAKGHIPGAIPVDVDAWKKQGLKDAGKGLEDKAAWNGMVRKLGITEKSHVVVYGGANPLAATRIWWTLRYLGVEDASFLDGGWIAWTEAKGESSVEVPPGFNLTEFEVEFQTDRNASIDWVKENHKKDGVAMMDTRSETEYAEHVPGATRLEWHELLDEKQRLKPVEELQKIFAEKGFTKENEIVVYCKTGGRASLNAFALELAGYEKVRSYYPGWGLWGSDESTPKEKVKSEGTKK